MLVKFGNEAPRHDIEPQYDDGAPRVTYLHLPDSYVDKRGTEHYDFNPDLDVDAFHHHIIEAHSPYLPADRQGITRVGDLGYGNQEALLSVVHPNGIWPSHSAKAPTWVSSDNPEFSKRLSDHYGISHGEPKDVEDTHYTRLGARILPPGVHPRVYGADPQMALVNAGRLLQSNMMGGGQVGVTGAGTAATATTFTTNATLTTNAWAGYRVYVYSTTGTQIVWANVISNTNAAGASVLTVDRWYNAATPGGAAATTPSTPFGFILADGGSTSAWFMGLSATAVGAATATSLAGEITTAGGGLIRKISPYANTSTTSPVTWTLTPVFTANGTDSLPVTVATIATFVSMVVADTTNSMLASTSLSSSATLSASGDQLTVTDTWTGS